MNDTIKQIGAENPPPAELAPTRPAQLVAQWQGGPQTFCGLEQRKLRLVLAPLIIVEGGNSYAIR